eukprot:COSAG01_NODE_2119_length_8380_cov_44.533510_2_plen_833_part_00
MAHLVALYCALAFCTVAVAPSVMQRNGDQFADVYYHLGEVKSFTYEAVVKSSGFRDRNGGTRGDQQHERFACRCNITATHHYNDSSWLLKLKVFDMRHVSLDRYGNAREIPAPVEDEELLQHPFYVVQRHSGAIANVFYPSQESHDVVNLKKTVADSFHTRMDLFSHEKFTSSPDSDGGEVIQEEDGRGIYNATYSRHLVKDHHVIRRHCKHHHSRYMTSMTHDPSHPDLLDKSEIFHTTDVHIHNHSKKIQFVSKIQSVKLDHSKPRYMETVAESLLSNHQVKARSEASSTLRLVATYAGNESRKDFSPAAAARAVKGLVKDHCICAHDWKARRNERLKQDIDSPEEVLACFERRRQNATCTSRLLQLIKYNNTAFEDHFATFEQQSPVVKAILIDAVPLIGTVSAQNWLVTVLLRYDPAKDLDKPIVVRAVSTSHHILKPHVELLYVLNRMSNDPTLQLEFRQAALLALGTCAGRTLPEHRDRVFSQLRDRLQILKDGDGSDPHDMEMMGTILRALGNQGDPRLLDITPWFHAHAADTVRETAAHVLRRISNDDAERRLLWVATADPNATAQIAAIEALMHSERANSPNVVHTFEDQLLTQPALDEQVESRMLFYLQVEAPETLAHCNATRQQFKLQETQQPQPRRNLMQIEAFGNNVTLDLSSIQTTLLDVYLGKNFVLDKNLGHEQFGAAFKAKSDNFAALRLSLFGGEFEVNLVTEAVLKVHGFGMSMDIIKGALAFNAGMSYKNTIWDQIEDSMHTGGKYVNVAMDASRVGLMGMEAGLTFAANKTKKVADAIDYTLDKVQLVEKVVETLTKSNNFSQGFADVRHS